MNSCVLMVRKACGKSERNREASINNYVIPSHLSTQILLGDGRKGKKKEMKVRGKEREEVKFNPGHVAPTSLLTVTGHLSAR